MPFRTALLAALAASAAAAAQEEPSGDAFTVRAVEIADEKSVFATVESLNVVAARARIGGTVAELSVDEGDRVEEGEVVAVVADEKLALQIAAANARVRAAESAFANARTEFNRAQDLFDRGIIPRARFDEAQTAFDQAQGQLDTARADADVLRRQVEEGDVLAPASGIVLRAPVTTGAVVLPGEAVAHVAREDYVLRLRLPERHARFIGEGDSIRVDPADLRDHGAAEGRIVQVYPEIADGRVLADAEVEGLGDFFVGERVRVWVGAGSRAAYIVPADYVATRFGVDYVRVRQGEETVDVVVQRGSRAVVDGVEGIEILSGLADGDVLVRP
jgi:RND family efflux transporter MFP subunit